MDDWLMNRRSQQELDETEHTRNTTTLIDRHTDEEKIEDGGEELPRELSYSDLTAVDGTEEDCQSLLLDSSTRTPNDTADKQHTTNYGSIDEERSSNGNTVVSFQRGIANRMSTMSVASFRTSASYKAAARRYTEQSFVLAPDDVSLPPNTMLLGSSRVAANLLINNSTEEDDHIDTNDNDDDDHVTLHTNQSIQTCRTLQQIETQYLHKARTTFLNDTITFAEGTIPQSIIMAICIGCTCGLVAYVYYTILDYLLDVVWKVIPEQYIIDKWNEKFYVLYIPIATFSLSICCGLSIYYLGEPGDLAFTINSIHEKGYKATQCIIPMLFASLFTILAGCSLGPEAPLVGISAATAGYISRKVFKQTNRNVIRKHTFMGMAGALSAFFGVPLGGSLFALEVTSRFGIEYFEHLMETIFAGEICVMVFRSLTGLPLGQIWTISSTRIPEAEPYMILLGGSIGLCGAGVAYLWANMHWRIMDMFKVLNLLDDDNVYAVPRALFGATAVVIIGMLVPHTMFWGEFEFGILATLSPAEDLPHVWPTSGLIGFEADTCLNCIIVGCLKLLAISFTVCGGFRGGFIFPFFTAGASLGRALCFVFPTLSPVIATLCFAAGINVAITRTARKLCIS